MRADIKQNDIIIETMEGTLDKTLLKNMVALNKILMLLIVQT